MAATFTLIGISIAISGVIFACPIFMTVGGIVAGVSLACSGGK